MKKKVWIFNHYATNSFYNRGGRHYWFAEKLINSGYDTTIFCANTRHNSNDVVDTKGQKYVVKNANDIPYVFVNTPEYHGNGKKRILNMVVFFARLFIVAKNYVKQNGKPDIIIASSVHPLTLVAGIKIAKKMNIPCICEVRDLWPETIIAYGSLKKDSLIAKILYRGEKWIYEKADRLIFTMEGGKDYIADQKWDIANGGRVDLDKVYHINNGIDLNSYMRNILEHQYEDKDLDNPNEFKVVYAGSIRKVNNLNLVINAAKYIQNSSHKNIKFLIFGDGDEKEYLQKKCNDEKINNVIFKGKVKKQNIPYILSKSDLNVLNYSSHDIWKYGGSQNKIFEYLASGKPILSTISMGYDIIKKYNAGISLELQTPESIGEAVLSIAKMREEDYLRISENAKNASKDYDFNKLTEKLINIIDGL